MDCKATRHWHLVIDGDNVPETSETVVGVWISTSEPMAELCQYDPESNEWTSMNPDTKGDPISEPDYWMEFPD